MATLLSRFLSISPAAPAFLILFGMAFAFAVVDLTGAGWRPGITVVLYSATLVWTLGLTWRHRHDLSRWHPLDLVLAAFVAVILFSLLGHGNWGGFTSGHPRFLPFMLLAPYLCGRLMHRRDVEQFARLVVYATIAMLPFLLWDTYTSPAAAGRQPFFGQDHSPLLVGQLIALALVAAGARREAYGTAPATVLRPIWPFAWLALLTVFLVWVAARGWLVGALAGYVALLASAWFCRELVRAYFYRLTFVLAVAWLTLWLFPDLNYFYARLLFEPTRLTGQAEFGPILGLASCKPIEEGVDSVAIRWVLYQEAVAQFLLAPVLGNGAGMFGARSCLGPGGFPHNTILQGFSELGLLGGLIQVALFALAVHALTGAIRQTERLADSTYLPLIMALFASCLIGDQIYGNYFMASGTYLMLGIIASIGARTTRTT